MVRKNNKKITIDDLAIMVAKGFVGMEERFNKVEKDINDIKENIRITRSDVLNIGDKFVSHHTFDQLSSRVSNIEKKIK